MELYTLILMSVISRAIFKFCWKRAGATIMSQFAKNFSFFFFYKKRPSQLYYKYNCIKFMKPIHTKSTGRSYKKIAQPVSEG